MTQEEREWTISDIFCYLLKRSGKTIDAVAREAGVPRNTLYTISTRKTIRAQPKMLKALAEAFGEDMSIFCGLDGYDPPTRLSEEQKQLLSDFDLLTEAAKERVRAFLEDVLENPKNRI